MTPPFNPATDLFCGTYPNAYVYTDRRKEHRGSYAEIGRITFNPLVMKIYDHQPEYQQVHDMIRQDYERLKIDGYAVVSATGQTVKVGGPYRP
jgi:hypothetical protein